MINNDTRLSTRMAPMSKAPLGVVCSVTSLKFGVYQGAADASPRGRRP